MFDNGDTRLDKGVRLRDSSRTKMIRFTFTVSLVERIHLQRCRFSCL